MNNQTIDGVPCDYTELKRLAEAVRDDETDWQPNQITYDYFQALRDTSTVLTLIADNEALRKKADRYDWLAKQAETESYCGGEWSLPLVNAWDFKPGPQLNEQFKTSDDAIDAAMREDDND